MNNEWSATRGTSGPKHTVHLPTGGSKAAHWLSEHVRQKKATLLWTSHANTCIQCNSEEILNILQWRKIRGCDSESAGIFSSYMEQRLTWTVFFCFEFAHAPEQRCACTWGAHLEIFIFHFILCEACFSSTLELTSALSCLFAWALTSHIMQQNQLFILLLLPLFLNICIFVFVFNRKTPQMTIDLWSISFPMRVDSPSLTPFQSFLMHRKFCYLQALQKMRFEHCFQLGASESVLLLYPFAWCPYLETLNSIAAFYSYILRIFLQLPKHKRI